jgi:hypothetical protein
MSLKEMCDWRNTLSQHSSVPGLVSITKSTNKEVGKVEQGEGRCRTGNLHVLTVM